jgi:hypothetical protein
MVGGTVASQAVALAVGKASGPLACSLFACKPLYLVLLAESYIVQECYPLHAINYTQDASQVGTSGVFKERWMIGSAITISNGNVWPYICDISFNFIHREWPLERQIWIFQIVLSGSQKWRSKWG